VAASGSGSGVGVVGSRPFELNVSRSVERAHFGT